MCGSIYSPTQNLNLFNIDPNPFLSHTSFSFSFPRFTTPKECGRQYENMSPHNQPLLATQPLPPSSQLSPTECISRGCKKARYMRSQFSEVSSSGTGIARFSGRRPKTVVKHPRDTLFHHSYSHARSHSGLTFKTNKHHRPIRSMRFTRVIFVTYGVKIGDSTYPVANDVDS